GGRRTPYPADDLAAGSKRSRYQGGRSASRGVSQSFAPSDESRHSVIDLPLGGQLVRVAVRGSQRDRARVGEALGQLLDHRVEQARKLEPCLREMRRHIGKQLQTVPSAARIL